ncbi:hypothetical protein GC722_06515 [Auraticoccus sp. F435]|uniref:Uncharacterized protein n=1 Tax=Auraticoccus cholistanensis TaxID=2656650 RepID=A0A6A9USS6_9ACTN|nr:hypothetical protein [Auraticoccus cholistanensis]MVA75678.1 hypothetical protein [Auraticoccus cholistanensis]
MTSPEPASAARPDGPRLRRAVRVVAWVLALLVAVPVVVYVVHGGIGSIRGVALRREVAGEVAERRAVVQPEVLALRERQRAVLPEPPTHSWAALQCAFGTTEGGWIVQAYHQSCWFTTLDLYPVASEDEAVQRAGALPAELFGAPGEDPGYAVHCRVLTSSVEPSSEAGTQLLWVPGGAVAPGDQHCSRLTLGQYAADAVEPLDPTSVDPGTDWLVVSNQAPVLERRELGCSPWSLVFCSRPWDEPVLG